MEERFCILGLHLEMHASRHGLGGGRTWAALGGGEGIRQGEDSSDGGAEESGESGCRLGNPWEGGGVER